LKDDLLQVDSKVDTKASQADWKAVFSETGYELDEASQLAHLFPRPFLIITAAGFAVVLPFFLLGILAGHDFAFHMNSWMEVLAQWKQGIVYPRWAAFANHGYGEPRFIFYPPCSWLLGALLGIVLPWKLVPGAFVWLALTLSGCSMFYLARTWLKPRDAIFAAALYATNPYGLVIVYWRSDFAELLAGALLPLFLLFCLRAEEKGSRSLLFLSLIIAAAWLTNAPVAVIASYSLVVLLLVIAVIRRSLRVFLVGIAACGFGTALSAFYVLPAAYEQAWINIGEVLTKGLRPQDNFLFTSIGDSGHDAFNRLLTIVVISEAVTMIVALVFARSRQLRLGKDFLWVLLVWATVAVFLMLPVSAPLWTYLPKLQFLQFPWRWLLCLNVAFALFVTVAWQSSAGRFALYIAMVAMLLFAAWRIQRPWKDTGADIARMGDRQKSGQGYKGRPEYIPKGADSNHVDEGAKLLALEGNRVAQINVQKWDAESKVIAITASAPGHLVLRLFNYPAWKLEVNGHAVESETRAGTGQMLIPVQAGENAVRISFARTWDRTWGVIISAMSALVLFLTTGFPASRDKTSLIIGASRMPALQTKKL
jgi:hypothetical protein